MKKAQIFIRRQNLEWPSAAGGFTSQTAAFIVTASKSAPITPPPTSTANGASAGARHAIIFSIDRRCSEKCAWAQISLTSASARRQKKSARPPRQARVQPRRRHRHLRQLRLRLQNP